MKIDTQHQYNIKSGTVDNKNPKSVYIQISAWGKPKDSSIEDYDSILKRKSKRVKKKLFEVLDDNNFYKDKSIVDFNMASSGVNYDKRSFMSVEVTLFKKEPLLSILGKALQYFEDTEQYERCAKLLTLKKLKRNIQNN